MKLLCNFSLFLEALLSAEESQRFWGAESISYMLCMNVITHH